MLCADFEDRLSDYLDGSLEAETHRLFAEHALRCPVCHETLSQVRYTLQACRAAETPAPSAELEARILLRTMPETAMTCEEFEESLTDYLDGFLPAAMYHRWERHAALCQRCTELPGEVVRSIGACYTYKAEELPLPAGLEGRILDATLGTIAPRDIRASLSARIAEWLRLRLDPIISPQLATVAMMLLVAIFVLTNTVSADGSISGMYQESLRLAGRSYVSAPPAEGPGLSGVKEFFVGPQAQSTETPQPNNQNQSDKRPDDTQGSEAQKPPAAPKKERGNRQR
jgi:anti-sigma factor RsiW